MGRHRYTSRRAPLAFAKTSANNLLITAKTLVAICYSWYLLDNKCSEYFFIFYYVVKKSSQ